jgi:hypothetical protein
VTRFLPIATLITAIGLAAGPGTPRAVAQTAVADATPAAKATENPAVTERAKTEFLAWQSGNVDLKHYSSKAAAMFNDETIANIKPQLEVLGKLKSFTYKATAKAQGDTVYAYKVTCANGALEMTFVLDPNDKIDGLFFRPA